MLTQSISNSLLKEFARRKSEIEFIEGDRLCHTKASGVKREVKSPQYTELDEPPSKLSRSSPTSIRNERRGQKYISKEPLLLLPPASEMLARNYSDIMRNLAAKYNNNDFVDERAHYNSEKFDRTQVDSLQKNNKMIAPNVDELPQFDSSMHPMSFLTGFSLSTGIIPHILDMSSTQALITLVS